MSSSSGAATVAILSIGDMGLGVARLLLAHDFRVITNVAGRSQATKTRAENNSIELVPDDETLVERADYILSIVPPRDAAATAQRILKASSSQRSSAQPQSRLPPCFLDLNAISPRSAREIQDSFSSASSKIGVLDGAIIGSPPHPGSDEASSWYRPSIPMSGPFRLADDRRPDGARLAEVLRITHIGDAVGAASGLKMCFAALSKGFTALAIQSYTTAHNLGVLEELKGLLDTNFPEVRKRAERGLVGMPPKAYRWSREMEEIAQTFSEDGGFAPNEAIFDCIARIYDLVAYETELGKEVTENRVRGKTADDVAVLISEGTTRRRAKSV